MAQWHPLLRTAYLLTGDHGRAEDLLQTALVRTHRHWTGIRRADAPEVYVRRVMVNLSNSRWRRRRVSEHVTGTVPDRPGDLEDELRAALSARAGTVTTGPVPFEATSRRIGRA